MKSKVVHSEDPNEHWSDIELIENQVILDLGCGWLFQPHESTPEYFINRGAKQVIGVDVTLSEIEKLNSKYYPTHKFVCKAVTSTDVLKELIEQYNPTVIKMDIEGHEEHLEGLTDLKSVVEVAIEYHNPKCKEIVVRKLQEFGFEITSINQFGFYCLDINMMGILHAKKVANL